MVGGLSPPPIGSIAVLSKTTLDVGSRVATIRSLTECLVGTRLHYRILSSDSGAGISVLGAGSGTLFVTVILIGCNTRMTLEGMAGCRSSGRIPALTGRT